MYLPDHVRRCICALENAGFRAYAVGGCVRDARLGLTPHDYDLCTDALPEQMQKVFADFPLVTAGVKHGTVGVVTQGEVVEITTFRTEGQYRDHRHPDWVAFVSDIREDLARRDFTVNAMAYNPTEGFIDPFGGLEDLQNHILRAVGEPAVRFEEDALRILRGVRFCAAYHLEPDSKTETAMRSQSPLMASLARERVFEELSKLLLRTDAENLLRFAPVLAAVIPELGPMIGFDQRSPHHAYDLFTHTAYVTGNVPADPVLRWAGLLHDTGKITAFTTDETGRGHFYGHAKHSREIAEAILLRLKAPTALREQVLQLIELHMTKIEPTPKAMRRWLSRLGEDTLRSLLSLQRADMGSKGTGEGDDSQFIRLLALLDEVLAENACLSLKDLAVDGNDLMALGLSGREIGNTLQQLLDDALDERLENKKEVLINAIRMRTIH